jgi:hypothetical protein
MSDEQAIRVLDIWALIDSPDDAEPIRTDHLI